MYKREERNFFLNLMNETNLFDEVKNNRKKVEYYRF
jgi:hypothetical protein